MSLYKKILVPVDGSPTSTRGLREAIRIAKDQKASLALVHVLDEYYALAVPEVVPNVADVIDALKVGARRILARAEAQARTAGVKAVSIMPEILGGRAADEIVKQAKKLGTDLIVLGTHGRRGVKRLALGSDAEQVVRRAAVPVLLVRGKD
jgi:nucleotide-binding universal stress UspA family protein